jgi:hypothetical protein
MKQNEVDESLFSTPSFVDHAEGGGPSQQLDQWLDERELEQGPGQDSLSGACPVSGPP